jgi:hypothetical protein
VQQSGVGCNTGFAASGAKATPSLWTRVVLNRCALTTSLINREFGFTTVNGSVPSISILISMPARRSRAGTDRITVSPSSMLCNGTATSNSRCEPCQAQVNVDLIDAQLNPSISAVRVVRMRAGGTKDVECLDSKDFSSSARRSDADNAGRLRRARRLGRRRVDCRSSSG